GLDRAHVPAAALDALHLGIVAEKIAHARLHRGVAAAVQDELGIAPEKPRGVDAQRHVGADPLRRVFPDKSLRVVIDPGAFHLELRTCRRRTVAPPSRCGADGRPLQLRARMPGLAAPAVAPSLPARAPIRRTSQPARRRNKAAPPLARSSAAVSSRLRAFPPG